MARSSILPLTTRRAAGSSAPLTTCRWYLGAVYGRMPWARALQYRHARLGIHGLQIPGWAWLGRHARYCRIEYSPRDKDWTGWMTSEPLARAAASDTSRPDLRIQFVIHYPSSTLCGQTCFRGKSSSADGVDRTGHQGHKRQSPPTLSP